MKAHLFEQPFPVTLIKSSASTHLISAPAQPSHPKSLAHSSKNNPGYTPNLISNSRTRMKPQLPNLPSRTTCHHLYPSGKRCRFPVMPANLFCAQHLDSGFGAAPDVDISRHFGPDSLNFKSACEVNDFLCALAKLMIENRVSARRASVLAYIASLQLRTLPAIDHELNGGDGFGRIVFDPPEPLEITPHVTVEHTSGSDADASVATRS
jgi:hypothetical protein